MILSFPQINPQNIFSLLLFISVYFLIRVSFSFLFIYLFVFSLFLFISGFILFFFNFCFLSLTFHFFYYFSFVLLFFFSFLFFLSVFGRPRSFGIPKTSSGPSNPEIHSLLTFMSLRSNRNEGLPSLCYKRRGRGTIEGVTILLLWGRPLGFSLLTSFRVLVLMRLGFLSY